MKLTGEVSDELKEFLKNKPSGFYEYKGEIFGYSAMKVNGIKRNPEDGSLYLEIENGVSG